LKKLAAAVSEETKRRENTATTQLFVSALQQLQSCFTAPIVYTNALLSQRNGRFTRATGIVFKVGQDLRRASATGLHHGVGICAILEKRVFERNARAHPDDAWNAPTFCSIKAEEGPIKEFLKLLTWPDGKARPPFSTNPS